MKNFGNKSGLRGRSGKQGAALQRFFGGMEVVEATEPLRVFASADDIKKATKGDPRHCVLARACNRLFGSSAVLIFKTVAYVDLPDEKGVRKVNRFSVGVKAGRQIVNYDKTGKFPAGGFTFSVPADGSTLDSYRNYQIERKRLIRTGKRRVDPQKSALMKGIVKGVKKSALLTGVRDGSGMVHFVS